MCCLNGQGPCRCSQDRHQLACPCCTHTQQLVTTIYSSFIQTVTYVHTPVAHDASPVTRGACLWLGPCPLGMTACRTPGAQHTHAENRLCKQAKSNCSTCDAWPSKMWVHAGHSNKAELVLTSMQASAHRATCTSSWLASRSFPGLSACVHVTMVITPGAQQRCWARSAAWGGMLTWARPVSQSLAGARACQRRLRSSGAACGAGSPAQTWAAAQQHSTCGCKSVIVTSLVIWQPTEAVFSHVVARGFIGLKARTHHTLLRLYPRLCRVTWAALQLLVQACCGR